MAYGSPIRLVVLLSALACVCPLANGQRSSETQKSAAKDKDVMGEFRRNVREIQWISRNPSLLAELQLTDEQVKTLEETGKKYDAQFKQIFEGRDDAIAEIRALRKAGDKERAKELWQEFEREIARLASAKTEVVTKTLLPHQLDRLHQVRLRQELHRRNPRAEPFSSTLMLADRLGLSKSEKEELQKATLKAREEYYRDLEKLKQKANERILNSLPAEARKQLRGLVGEDYDIGRAYRDAVATWKRIDKENKSQKTRDDAKREKRIEKEIDKTIKRAS